MITDVFFRRYVEVPLFPSFGERERRFLGQAAQIITDDLLPRNESRFKEAATDPAVKAQDLAHQKLARELGVDWLVTPRWTHTWKAPNGNDVSQSFARSTHDKTKLYLTQAIGETSSPELFTKFRISFVELCFQEKAKQLGARRAQLEWSLTQNNSAIRLYDALQVGGTSWQSKEKADIEQQKAAFVAATEELNGRFQQGRIPLVYHNGLIQMSDDTLVSDHVERPFWRLVAQAKWQNVDQLIKEAIDKRDRSERDAVTPAMQALESVIKIISDERDWTSGSERGASNYIDNLVKERDGSRFIAVWEKDALVRLFGEIRNHFGHGPGAQPLPTLRPEQTEWAIENAMIWIKSLVRRHT